MAKDIVFVRFFPFGASFEAVRSILSEMVVHTRTEPGCLLYDLYEADDPDSDERILCLVEQYKDAAAVAAHREAAYYKAYRAAIPDLLRRPIEVNLLSPIDVA